MNITDVRINLATEDRLKAYVSLVIDDCFIVKDIRIIDGPSGIFVAMPSKKRKDGQFQDIAHPLNQETRVRIENLILDKFYAEIEKLKTL